MNTEEVPTAQIVMNTKNDVHEEPVTQALENEQSSGSEKNRTEENVADRSSQPPSEKAGNESDHDVSPSDLSSDTSVQSNDASFSSWATVWDETSQAYYWWNMITNETTWDNPHEKLQQKATEQSTIDNDTVPAATPTASPSASPAVTTAPAATLPSKTYPNNNNNNSYYYRPYTDAYRYRYRNDLPPELEDSTYTFYAHFNTRTGKFQTTADVYRLNPERMSIANRATRQMQYYFDVHAYMEQRNLEKTMGTTRKGMKRPLSKKEIEHFKKAKHEKKMKRAREWLCD